MVVATVTIGVLALQGDVREHAAALAATGAQALVVRTADDLAAVDALVIPGGESTSIRKLLDWNGLRAALAERIGDGMPVLGTCAGLIIIAHAAADAAPPTLGALDVTVSRNGFGRQIHSHESEVVWTEAAEAAGITPAGTTSTGVFIRAPRIERTGNGVEILATLESGEPVAVQQGRLLGCSFHPELTDAHQLHELLARLAVED